MEPVRVDCRFLDGLFDHIMMFWTGMQRLSSSVLKEQKANIPQKLATLEQIREYALQMRELAVCGIFDPLAYGRILDESWQLKRQLASNISSGSLDRIYDRARKAGAEGGKICGAGQGGFFLFIVQPEQQAAVRRALPDLTEVPVGFEAYGSRVLLPIED